MGWGLCEECVPSLYLKGVNGIQPDSVHYYCTDKHDQGGGINGDGTACEQSGSGWSWQLYSGVDYRCARVGPKYCECTGNGCGGICYCTMKNSPGVGANNWIHEYCFHTRKQCDGCIAGQYRYDCGCAKSGKVLYNLKNNSARRRLLYFPSEERAGLIYVPPNTVSPKTTSKPEVKYEEKEWECGPGTCEPCPKGHFCPLQNNYLPIKCPVNSYQSETGKQHCIPCMCGANQYRDSEICDPINGFTCGSCNECSDNIKTTSDSTCPTRNYYKGLDKDNKCVLCQHETCVFPKVLYGDRAKNFCYMQNNAEPLDDAFQKCGYYYFDKTEPWSPSLMASMQLRSFQSTWSQSLINVGLIPWKQGHRRIKPIFTTPLPGLPEAEPRGYPGHLPFYTTCSDVPASAQWTTNDTRKIFLNTLNYALEYNWAYDCDSRYTQDCNGKPVWSGQMLLYCEQCPSNTRFQNGLCLCGSGFASTDQLSKIETFGYYTRVNPKSSCHECRSISDDDINLIQWRKTRGIWTTESLFCYNGLIQTATGPMQYLKVKTPVPTEGALHEWATCDPGFIPNEDRTDCTQCPRGQYSTIQNNAVKNIDNLKRYVCEYCASGYFSSTLGATSCTPKRTVCEPNKMLRTTDSNTEDNQCVDCTATCGPGFTQVFSGTPNGNLCDSNGRQLFGCYPIISAGNPMSAGSRLTFTDNNIVQVKCNINLLPHHSYFVEFSKNQQQGQECHFACLHGVNRHIASTILSKEREFAVGANAHLSSVLIGSSDNSEYNSRRDEFMYASYPKTIVEVSNDRISWMGERKYSILGSTTCTFCSAAIRENTFLFHETLFSNHRELYDQLCRSPEQSYQRPCSSGSLRANNTDAMATRESMHTTMNKDTLIKCAYDARKKLVKSYHEATDATWVSVGQGTEHQCLLTSENALETFELFECKRHCLDTEYSKATQMKSTLPLLSPRAQLLDIIIQYLEWKKWKDLGDNPYIFQTAGLCAFSCKATTSIKVDFASFYADQQYIGNAMACISCTDITSLRFLCAQKGKVLINTESPCNPSMLNVSTLLNVDDICTTCEATKQNSEGVVIANLLTNPGDMETWWTSRLNTGLTTYTTPDNTRKWNLQIKCRYSCGVGYYPNPDVSAYPSSPCLRCQDAIQGACTGLTNQNDAYFKGSVQCGILGANIAPVSFNSLCSRCRTDNVPQYITFMNGIYNSQQDCNATCDNSKYHNFDSAMDNNYTQHAIPYSRLTCQLCSMYPTIPCNSTCIENYFKEGSVCRPCNTSRCYSASEYRDKCFPQLSKNAACMPCSETYLRNADIMQIQDTMISDRLINTGLVSALRSVVNEHKDRIVRQYINFDVNMRNNIPALFLNSVPQLPASQLITEQCILVCQNNYAWIDIQTGLSPFSVPVVSPLSYNHNRHFCIPCDSLFFMKRDLINASQVTLFSVWNLFNNVALTFTSTSGISTLYDMSMYKRLPGACYACPNPQFEITRDNGTALCEVKQGYTNTPVVQSGSDIIFTGANENIGSQIIVKPFKSSNILNIIKGRNRRLLQADVEEQLQDNVSQEENLVVLHRRIRIYRHPSHLIKIGVSACCDQLYSTEDERTRCKNGKLIELESKLITETQNYGSTYCDNIKKKLIERPKRIGSRKLLQVEQQSTQINISLQYAYIDEPESKCPVGTFKEDFGDGPCIPCQSGASTIYPYTGSTSRNDCVCLEGFKTVRSGDLGIFNFRCEPCGFHFYRSYDSSMFANDSHCLPCPSGMYTPTASSSQCYCIPGFYLNVTSGECLTCPANSFCSENRRYSCPEFSSSLHGSSLRSQCVCNNKTHFGNLEIENSKCTELTTGVLCPLGSNNCNCGEGWQVSRDPSNYDKMICVTPCKAGQYVVQDDKDGSISGCINCPPNTYSSNSQAIGIDNCLSCPANTYTSGAGAANASDCICNGKKNDESSNASAFTCDVCQEGFYMENQTCKLCPGQLSSPRASVGINSCTLCPRGSRTIQNPDWLSSVPYACSPCPVGMFSSKIGTICTPCAKGYTTAGIGSTSPLLCILQV